MKFTPFRITLTDDLLEDMRTGEGMTPKEYAAQLDKELTEKYPGIDYVGLFPGEAILRGSFTTEQLRDIADAIDILTKWQQERAGE